MFTAQRYAAFLYRWQGIGGRDPGADSIEQVLQPLQAYGFAYPDLENLILPTRIPGYQYGDMDAWCRDGQLGWQGHGGGRSGGTVSLYLGHGMPRLARIPRMLSGSRFDRLRTLLAEADLEFEQIVSLTGGFPRQTLEVLWELVWNGEVSNHRMLALTSKQAQAQGLRRAPPRRRLQVPGRIQNPQGAAGRWYLVHGPRRAATSDEGRRRALLQQLFRRWGVLSARTLRAESLQGGWSRFRSALDLMIEEGSVLRGDFVAGLGTPQFALRDALDLLGESMEVPDAWVLALSDPANPWGKVLPPTEEMKAASRGRELRIVIGRNGPLAMLNAQGDQMWLLDRDGASPAETGRQLGVALGKAPGGRVALRSIDGQAVARSPMGSTLTRAGLVGGGRGAAASGVYSGSGRGLKKPLARGP